MKRFLTLAIVAAMQLAAAAQTDGWSIATNDYAGPYAPAAMANGELGIVVGREPFAAGPVIVGNSCERGNASAVSCILQGINPLGLSMQGLDAGAMDDWSQCVDMRRAVHTTSFQTDDAAVTYTIRALRNMPHALMLGVEVTARRDTHIVFDNSHSIPASFADAGREERTVWCEAGGRRIQRSAASYNSGASHIAASSAFICGERFVQTAAGRIEASLSRGKRASFVLVGAVCTTEAFADPWNESERQVIYAVRQGADALTAAHERMWSDLWRGDIEIEGDSAAQTAVRFALFNLYSSVREGSRRGIAPMGLTSTGYNGHIFWDAEMWMLPVLAVLHPELARSMVDYRTDRLSAARRRAAAYGYRGAMFPWESDPSGEEATPTFALTGPLEHHITADVAIGAWMYYCATHDDGWLRREGYPLMRECAEFWCSRAERNADGSFSIRNVVGADEYAEGVDDNAFTNGAARRALEYAAAAARRCGEKPSAEWLAIARGLRICTFDDGTTREHDSYDGRMTKQADANLLGYPLGLVSDREAQLRDMDYYAGRIDPRNGPAMTWSVFAVQYARAGKAGRAQEMFRRSYEHNVRPPFGVFAETASSDNPYFMTGAGGMLQAVLFGFGGLEITGRGVVRRGGVLPDGWTRLTIRCAGSGKTYVR